MPPLPPHLLPPQFLHPRERNYSTSTYYHANNNLTGLQAEEIMKKGGLVHDSFMINLIVEEFARRGWVEPRGTHTAGLFSSTATRINNSNISQSFLLDGFPRTLGQAQRLDEQINMNFVNLPLLSCLTLPPKSHS